MGRRIIASLMLGFLLLGFAAPVRTAASPDWWTRFREIVIADAEGAVEGLLSTGSAAGAIAGSVRASIEAATHSGVIGATWQPDDDMLESIGLHHNLALSYVYSDKATPKLFESVSEGHELSQDEWRVVDTWIEEYLKSVGLAPTAIPDDGEHVKPVVSENFAANMEKAKEILVGESKDPQESLNQAIAFLLSASLRETDSELGDDIVIKAQDYNSSRSNKARGIFYPGDLDSPLDYGKIEVTYKQQLTNGQPVDIILAWVYADVLQHASVYWSDVYCWGEGISGSREQVADGNGSVLCWGANFADIAVRTDVETLLDSMDIVVLVPARAGIRLTVNSPVAMVGDREVALDVVPVIVGSRTMVPFRFVGEALGAELDWIQDSGTVTYLRETAEGTVSIEMVIGRNRAMVNGVSVPIDSTNASVVPVIIRGRTLVPVRFISEALGFEVDWIQESGEVVISAGR